METHTTSQKKALDRPRLKPVYLIEITLQGAGAPTLYFSDRNIPIGSQIYENYLSDLSGLGEEIERATSEGLNPDISLAFKNSRFMAHNYLIEIGNTYPFEGAVTIIKEVYLDDSNVPSEVRTIFKGALDQPRDTDELFFGCPVSAMTLVKDTQWKQSMITKAVYPNADPDDLNKYENIIYGHCEQVRCHAIKAGAADSLTDTWSATSPGNGETREISDASELPSSGAFTIQIHAEQIRIASRSGNTLTLASSGARGYNSTVAASHDIGSPVFEVLTEYVYLLAKHAVKAIGDVYVDGVRQLSGVTKYTGQSGDAHANYAGKAVIAFTTKPFISKQVNFSDAAVNDPAHSHGGSPAYDTVALDTSDTSGYGNLFDGNHSTYVAMPWLTAVTLRRNASVGSNYATKMRVHVKAGNSGMINGTLNMVFKLSGVEKYNADYNFPNYSGPTEITTPWYTITGWSQVYAANTTFKVTRVDANTLYVYEIWYEVENYASSPDTGYTGITLSGTSSADAVIGESVNADADGYRDDGSGTYTGSANALIERPDHVFKHFIDVLYGFAITDIDSTTFSAAGTLYAAAISGGYKFGICINSEITPSRFMYGLAPQCRSNLKYDKGLWKLLYLPDTAPAAVKTISKSNLAGEFAKFRFNRTDNINIANDLTALFSQNYGRMLDESEWLGTATASDATSQGKYGVRPLTVLFSAVRLQAMADHVLAFMKLLRKNPLLTVDFPVFWEHFDLERGDTFDISNPLYNAVKFYIERIGRPEKGIENITAIQWP